MYEPSIESSAEESSRRLDQQDHSEPGDWKNEREAKTAIVKATNTGSFPHTHALSSTPNQAEAGDTTDRETRDDDEDTDMRW